MLQTDFQLDLEGEFNEQQLTVDKFWTQVLTEASTEIKVNGRRLSHNVEDRGKDFNIWNLSTLPERIQKNIWHKIAMSDILKSVFSFMFGIFLLLTLWHFTIWESKNTGLCDIYSFLFLYGGFYMVIGLCNIWACLHWMVNMPRMTSTIWWQLLAYALFVILNACV